MLDYEDFYFQIWNYFISESDVSFDYREENIDFIRAVTFSFFKEYERNNVNVSVYGKVLKIIFSNMFLHSPKTFDNGEIRDFNCCWVVEY